MTVINNALLSLVSRNLPYNGIMVEVGCNDGYNTCRYAQSVKNKNGKIFVVDWFEGNTGEPPNHSHGHRPDETEILKNKFISNIDSVGCMDICTIYQGLSWEQAINFEDNSIDICFIDACHKYQSVKKDIEAYLPKVKSGGILCGHDFDGWHLLGHATDNDLEKQCSSMGHFGAVYAVNDFFKPEEIELPGDTIWVYRKK